MKNKSRRIFLRNTSLATTGVLLVSPLAASKKTSGSRQSISCGPGSLNSLTGTITSVQSGKWSDASTWGGQVPGTNDTPVISTGHTVEFDKDSIVSGININSGGVLQFDASRSVELQSTQNIVVLGKLLMKPSSASVQHRIRFIGINESNFVGGGHNVLDSDIGLWTMGSGQLDLAGTKKKGWTRTTGSVNRGAASFSVQDASGWAVGDDIVLVPTDTPGVDTFNWNDVANIPIDSFALKFERRSVTAISGNTVTVNLPFAYDHDQVSTDSGKTWTPEVANLSRNVRIEGTATGRSHIFIRSTMPQSIYYIAGRYLGPRKKISSSRPELVTGRYGLHFHHCNDGSQGSMVEGCAIFDTGNRAYVPHMSNGITMNHNVAFDCMEASFWWDFQELSHFTTWDGNLSALVSRNGIDGACRGMEMNMGDGNVAINNVVVYGHNGDENSQGAYVWNADSEGVWVFENNLSHSNRSGLFVWQNTSNNHTIVGHESYNDHLGVFHGAYINSYTYTNCYFYNSVVRVKATSGNSSGVRFEKTVFDGGNQKPYVTEIYPSPVASGGDYNAFRECTFKNYQESAVRINTFPISGEITRKHISLIKCNFSGKMVDFTRESAHDSKAYIQPASGPSSVISQGGTSGVASFAPYVYGNGKGLKGEYYNGSNFEDHAFTRIDSMIMFQQWTYDKAASPTLVHHRIKNDSYSMRWTGMVEAQYSESYKFRLQGSGGFRLWIDNVKVIDSWTDRTDNQDSVTSAGINLVQGQKYDLKLEHMNAGGARACQLFWECPSIGRSIHIPQSQLYTDAVITPVAVQKAPVASAGSDITLTLPVSSAMLDGSASSPAATVNSYEWTQISGPGKGNLVNKASASTEVKDLVEGIYMFRLKVTDKNGNAATDDVIVTVNPASKSNQQILGANAGLDMIITLPVSKVLLDGTASSPVASIKSYAWTQTSGPSQANFANKNGATTEVTDLVEGVYLFKLQVTDQAGNTATDEALITVNPENKSGQQQAVVANAGADVTITLPVNKAQLDGSASTPAASIQSYTWSQITGPVQVNFIHKFSPATEIQDLTEGTYLFRLQITDKNGVLQTDDVVVTVNPAATTTNNQTVVANAGADVTITLPVSKAQLDGSTSSPAASIKAYEWSQVAGPAQASYSNKKAAATEVRDLVEGTYLFRLQITDKDGATKTDDVVVTVNPEPKANNYTLVANAGTDLTITLPNNKVVLDSSGSSPASAVKSYEWSQVSGPGQGGIGSKTKVSTDVSNLVEGTYIFRVKITDTKGAIATDDVQVTVKPQPPVANAGADNAITLPVNSVVLNGSASSAPSGISVYEWSKISGPSKFRILNKNAISPVIKDLEVGTYVFQLKITDRKGNSATDEVTITVMSSSSTTNTQKQTETRREFSLTASQNPSPSGVDTILSISTPSQAPVRLTIYNQFGKSVATYPNLTNGSKVQWGGSAKKGTYFALAQQGAQMKTVKIMKL